MGKITHSHSQRFPAPCTPKSKQVAWENPNYPTSPQRVSLCTTDSSIWDAPDILFLFKSHLYCTGSQF
ncbi:MAG: hypothetical protein MJK14_08830, partial [Rivularia sp. ALOHA_DT_140]|nr:hypothetical protein [Rivularia sp. ALOHA_DT_140]